MFIQKNISLKRMWRFSGGHIIWMTIWAIVVTVFHELFHPRWMNIPWLPLSIIATAVAFYVGFKNNNAYDRLWEARKIWGAIVNSSRMWGTTVKGFVTNHFNDGDKLNADELLSIKRELLYRHCAWLYALRSQLLIPTSWEHVSQTNKHIRNTAKRRIKELGVGMYDDEYTNIELHKFLKQDEFTKVIEFKNTATQLIDNQSQQLHSLREKNLIDDFRHMELQNILNEFYTHQGKAERIKKFPLPRQYGSVSLWFVGIFIFLLPLGMVSEFHKMGEFGAWLSIPFTVLVSWIYLMMELVGDYSENPFEGLGNDIPMLALCRTIEIDLREMLGETDLPEGIKPKNGVLM